MSAVSIRPVHRTRMMRTQSEYCFLADAARSAAPYPHFQQANKAILRTLLACLAVSTTSCADMLIIHHVILIYTSLALHAQVLGGALGFMAPLPWTGDGQFAREPRLRPAWFLRFGPPFDASGNIAAQLREQDSSTRTRHSPCTPFRLPPRCLFH